MSEIQYYGFILFVNLRPTVKPTFDSRSRIRPKTAYPHRNCNAVSNLKSLRIVILLVITVMNKDLQSSRQRCARKSHTVVCIFEPLGWPERALLTHLAFTSFTVCRYQRFAGLSTSSQPEPSPMLSPSPHIWAIVAVTAEETPHDCDN